MRLISIVCGALVIGSCNKSPEPAGSNQSVAAPSSFETQLRALKAPARNLAFRNAIRDFGLRCERVEKSNYQQSVKTAGMWIAHCSDTGEIAVFVGPTGYAQVRRCPDLKGADVPQCRAARS